MMQCPQCGGRGETGYIPPDVVVECPLCGGTGEVDRRFLRLVDRKGAEDLCDMCGQFRQCLIVEPYYVCQECWLRMRKARSAEAVVAKEVSE